MKDELKVPRARRDPAQAELSEAVEVTRQTIDAVERGRYHPSLELAFRLAESRTSSPRRGGGMVKGGAGDLRA